MSFSIFYEFLGEMKKAYSGLKYTEKIDLCILNMNERDKKIKEQDKTSKQDETHRFTTYQSNENQL